MSIQITRKEFEQHLREQMGFLAASCDAFDKGNEAEAKRIAGIIRTLIHDTKSSTSLLSHLGVKSALRLNDVIGPDFTNDPSQAIQGAPFQFHWHVQFGSGLKISTDGTATFVPNLGEAVRQLPFDDWWEAPLMIRDLEGTSIRLSRRDVVLTVANKQGGVHVDATLDADYVAVERNQAPMGTITRVTTISRESVPITNGPMLSTVRQIAHELVGTIRDQLPHLL